MWQRKRRLGPRSSEAARVARVHVSIDRTILEQVAELTAFAGYKGSKLPPSATRRYQPGQLAGARAFVQIHLSVQMGRLLVVLNDPESPSFRSASEESAERLVP